MVSRTPEEKRRPGPVGGPVIGEDLGSHLSIVSGGNKVANPLMAPRRGEISPPGKLADLSSPPHSSQDYGYDANNSGLGQLPSRGW